MKNIWLQIVLLFVLQLGYSQIEHPENGVLFDDDVVSRIDILISQDDLDQILDPSNLSLDIEYPAIFIFSQEGIKDTVENVGFRLRGNTSRLSDKPSFKVSFNTFEKGRQYRDVEKLNLNGEHNDPTIARSKLSWDIMKDQGLPASRTNHIQLYINETYRGLYLNVEHIDEEFLKKRFDDWSGNLYKCLWPADLTYISDNPNDYKVSQGDRRTYDLKTNTDKDDYNDLAHLIDVINNTPTNDLPCELEPIFDIQSYLRLVAADVFIGNWDGHFFNMNNFYLYNDPCQGKFVMMPYDLDNTYGIDWFNVDWSRSSLDFWVDNLSGDRPLIERLVKIPKYRRNIEDYLIDLMNQWEISNYQEEYYDLRDLLTPYRENDVFASLDYGYTPSDFKNNFTHGLSGHVTQGLIEYMDSRLFSLSQQLDLDGQQVPAVGYHSLDRTETSLDFIFSIDFVEEEKPMTINYKYDDGMWNTQPLLLNQDDLYITSIPRPIDGSQSLSWHLSLPYGIAGVSRYPICESNISRITPGPVPSLVINEVVSSNTNGLQDEADEYPDWIELYNAGDTLVNLGQYYLTDKREELQQWKLPDYDLEPNSYLILFADSDGHQGLFHTNFKLDKDGEFLALIDSKTNLNTVIDSLTLPALESDQSYGRLPNGSGDFMVLPNQSPNWNNENLSSTTLSSAQSEVLLSPNPVDRLLTVNTPLTGLINIYSTSGRTVLSEVIRTGNTVLDLSEVPSGIYIAIIIASNGRRHSQRIVKY